MNSHTGHVQHHGSPALYGRVLFALLMLTAFTVFVARHPFANNAINVIIALVVATVKASLVGLFFMHLRYDKRINSVALVSGFVFLGLLLFACLTDYTTRDQDAPHSAAPATGTPPPDVPGATPAATGSPAH